MEEPVISYTRANGSRDTMSAAEFSKDYDLYVKENPGVTIDMYDSKNNRYDIPIEEAGNAYSKRGMTYWVGQNNPHRKKPTQPKKEPASVSARAREVATPKQTATQPATPTATQSAKPSATQKVQRPQQVSQQPQQENQWTDWNKKFEENQQNAEPGSLVKLFEPLPTPFDKVKDKEPLPVPDTFYNREIAYQQEQKKKQREFLEKADKEAKEGRNRRVVVDDKGAIKSTSSYFAEKIAKNKADEIVAESGVTDFANKKIQEVIDNAKFKLEDMTFDNTVQPILADATAGAATGTTVGSAFNGVGAVPGFFAGLAGGTITGVADVYNRQISEKTSPAAIRRVLDNEETQKTFDTLINGTIIKDGQYTQKVLQGARAAGKDPETFVRENIFPQMSAAIEKSLDEDTKKRFGIHNFGELFVENLNNAISWGLHNYASRSASARQAREEAVAKATEEVKTKNSIFGDVEETTGGYRASVGEKIAASAVHAMTGAVSGDFKTAHVVGEVAQKAVGRALQRFTPFLSSFKGEGKVMAESFLANNLATMPQALRSTISNIPSGMGNLGFLMGTNSAMAKAQEIENWTYDDYYQNSTADVRQKIDKENAKRLEAKKKVAISNGLDPNQVYLSDDEKMRPWTVWDDFSNVLSAGYEGTKEGVRFHMGMMPVGMASNIAMMSSYNTLQRGLIRTGTHLGNISAMVGMDYLSEGSDFRLTPSLSGAVGMEIGLYFGDKSRYKRTASDIFSTAARVRARGWKALTAESPVRGPRLTDDELSFVAQRIGINPSGMGRTKLAYEIARVMNEGPTPTEGKDLDMRAKYGALFNKYLTPFSIRQKLGYSIFGDVQSFTPLYYGYNIIGDKAELRAKDGELIDVVKFDNKDELDSVIDNRSLVSEMQKLNANSLAYNIRPMADLVWKTYFGGDKMPDEKFDEMRKLLTSCDGKNVSDEMDTMIRLTNRNLADYIDNLHYDDVMNAPIAEQAGENAAKEADVMGDKPNAEPIQRTNQQLKDATERLEREETVLLDFLANGGDTDGLLIEIRSKGDLLNLNEEKLRSLETNPSLRDAVQEYLSARNNFNNANIRYTAMLKGIENDINQELDLYFAGIRNIDTDKEEEVQDRVINYTDSDGKQWYVRSGLDKDGKLTDKMVILVDEDGNVDYLRAEDVEAERISEPMDKEQAIGGLREYLRQRITEEYGLDKVAEEQQPTAGAEQSGAEAMQPETGAMQGQEEAQQGETPAETPEIQTDKDGNKLYFESGVEPKVAYDDIVNDLGGDRALAVEAIRGEVDLADEALKKIEKKKPKGISAIKAWQKEKQTAEARKTFWENVLEVENQRIAQENLERERQRAAARAREGAQGATGEAPTGEAQTSVPDWTVDKATDARARGYRMQNGERVDRQEPTDGVVGNEVEIDFTTGEKPVMGTLKVIESDALQPSHAGRQRNILHFIPEAQPKERTDAVSDVESDRIAQNMSPERITMSTNAYTGAPVVNERGEVIQGNNRATALRKMKNSPESRENYKKYLMEHSEEYGMKAEDIEKMQNPVLVREVKVADEEAIRLGQFKASDLETGGIERIEAKSTLAKMTEEHLSETMRRLFDSADEEKTIGQLIDDNGVKVLKYMRQIGAITDTQYQSAFNRKGELSEEARNDLRKLMLQNIFEGGSDRLPEAFEMLPAAAQKALPQAMAGDMRLEKADRLLPVVQRAIMAVAELKGSKALEGKTTYEGVKKAIEDASRQTDAFVGEPLTKKYSNLELELAARLLTYTQNNIKKIFSEYQRLIKGEGGGLFDPAEKLLREEAIKRVFDVEENNDTNKEKGTDDGTESKGRSTDDGNAESGQGNRGGGSQGEGKPTGEQPAGEGKPVEETPTVERPKSINDRIQISATYQGFREIEDFDGEPKRSKNLVSDLRQLLNAKVGDKFLGWTVVAKEGFGEGEHITNRAVYAEKDGKSVIVKQIIGRGGDNISVFFYRPLSEAERRTAIDFIKEHNNVKDYKELDAKLFKEVAETPEQKAAREYVAANPMTAEEIDATDVSAMRKELAKSYLNGEDISPMAKAAYNVALQSVKAMRGNAQSETPTATATEAPVAEQPARGTEEGGERPVSSGEGKPISNTGAEVEGGAKPQPADGTPETGAAARRSRFASLNAKLKGQKKNTDSRNTDAYSIEGLSVEQQDVMLDYVEAGAEGMYELMKEGAKSKKEILDTLRSEFAEGLKEAIGYTDKDVDELLEDMWTAPFIVDDKKKRIDEWAKDFGINDEKIENNNEGTTESAPNVEQPTGERPTTTTPATGGSEEVPVSKPANDKPNTEGGRGANNGSGNGGKQGQQGSTGKPATAGTQTNRGVSGNSGNGGSQPERPANDGGGTGGSAESSDVPTAGSSVGRNAVNLSQEKVPYVSASDPEGKHSIGSVIPSGIATAINETFKRFAEETKKNVTDFVRDELGYSSDEEMLSDSASGKSTGLASEQVDSVALAINAMKKGKSFIIGDMTGVGKGRQAAALIRWAREQGKKVIFVTESSKLFSAMYADLKDIGSDYMPYVVNEDTEANITDDNKVKLVPKPSNASHSALWKSGVYELPKDKKGRQYDVLMMTYSQAGSERGANAKNKLEWIKNYAKDAIVIMDESHNASGASNRGAYFKDIVENAAGVTFLSATYAKRPDNMMLYAMRSSLADVNMPKEEMFEAIKKYGVPMQEILANGLFSSGEMIRRERDMSDVKTTWVEPKEIYSEEEYEKARKTNDKTIDLVNDIIDFQRAYVDPIVKAHEDEYKDANTAAALTGGEMTHCNNSPYSGQVSNVVNLLTYGIKAKKAANMAIEQIKAGKKPVIAVENTLGSYVDEIEGEVDNAGFGNVFDKGVAFALRYNISRYKKNEETGRYEKVKESEQIFDATDELDGDGQRALALLRKRVQDYLGDTEIEQLTLSPIDLIKTMIADAGYNCGEITGRSKQLVKGADGKYHTEGISINKKDAARKFNGGSASSPLAEKDRYDCLVLNVAGATGISLHASQRFGDQKQRAMIILQPARDVNIEVQMRGRTDRTGQVSRSEYYYITSPIPAEQKMTMMLKQKLASLDANSVGTEEVSSNKVESQDMDNKYGDETAKEFLLEHLNDINAFLDGGLRYNNKTKEWEGHEGLLYDVLKGMQRMDCETQEFILDELTTRYADKIDYLNQNGINDLKTSVMKLDAVTIDKAMFVKGKDDKSTNDFAHSTNIERVEVNVLKKPLRATDIRTRMKKLGAMTTETVKDEAGNPTKTEEKYDDSYGTNIGERVIEVRDEMIAEREAKLKEAEEKLKEKVRQQLERGENETEEEFETRVNNWPSVTELRMRNDATLQQYKTDLTNQANAVYKATMYLKPGMPYLVPLTDELRDDAPRSYGRFLGFEVKNGQPRNIQAVFAVKDSRAQISIPCVNSSKVIDKIINDRNDPMIAEIRTGEDGYAEWNDEYAMPIVDKWWDARIPKNTNRQRRFMITGNILQACGSLGKYKGQIVTFTRKDSKTGEQTLERGMLLAENFDPENFKVRSAVRKEDIWDKYDELKDTVSKISASRQGDNMVVKFDKRVGQKLVDHPVLKDAELAALALETGDGTKYSKGKSDIVMMFPEKNVEKALELLYLNHSFTKERFFVMPDSTEKPDAIVRSNKPYEEIISELSDKYGFSSYSVQSEINRMMKQYKMDIDNEDLKSRIREAVTLRQAYLRKRYAKESSERLAWQVLIEDQSLDYYARQIDRAETDQELRDAKKYREEVYNRREAILEELEFRGVKGTAMHLEQGNWTVAEAKKTFGKLNTNKENAVLMEAVFAKLKDMPEMKVILNEKIDNDTGGQAAGQVIEYNWKYFNADYITDQAKADTILHEMIHTLTAYADRIVEEGMEHMIAPEMVEAINDLHQIYEAIKNQDIFVHNGARQYGLTNVREMLAECGANESFRQDLKKANLWTKIMDGILRFFGIERTGANKANAYESIRDRLEYLIENFNKDAWSKYYEGTRYGSYGYRRMADGRRVSANEQRIERQRTYAQGIVDGLGGNGKVVASKEELDAVGRSALHQNKNAKGWYNEKTGEVTIYLPNCKSRYDAQRMILHEKVGHEGLEGMLGKENFRRFYNGLWKSMTPEQRSLLSAKAQRNGWDYHEAMKEVLAEKAEDFTDSGRSFIQTVKDALNYVLAKVGFKTGMTEGDVRTALWLSKNRLSGNTNNLSYKIARAAFEAKVKRHHEAEPVSSHGYKWGRETERDESGEILSKVLFSKNMKDEDREKILAGMPPEAREDIRKYEQRLASWSYVWKESYADRLQAAREMLSVILKPKKGEKIDAKYDIAAKLEAMQSANQQAQEKLSREHLQPLFEEMRDLQEYFDGATPEERYNNFEAYAYVKHALERNRTFYVRDICAKRAQSDDADIAESARTFQENYDSLRENLYADLKDGKITLREYFDQLDDFISAEVGSTYDAGKMDMAGLSDINSATMARLGISTGTKGEYNDAEAVDFVMDCESRMNGGKAGSTNALWDRINAISNDNIEREYEAGIISKQARDRMKSMFSWYLPLRGFDAKTAEEMYGYIGANERGAFITTKRAEGRTSQAETPISTLCAMADYSVLRANRNKVKQTLAMLARDHKTPLLTEYDTWYKKDIENGEEVLVPYYPKLTDDMTAEEIHQEIEQFNADVEARIEAGETWVKLKDYKTNTPYRIAHDRDRSQHIVSCMIDGKRVDILVNGNPRAAQAINGLIHDTHWKGWDSMNRAMSQLMTSYSLTFMARNAFRDFQFALSSGLVADFKQGEKWNRNFVKVYADLALTTSAMGEKVDAQGNRTGLQGKGSGMLSLFSRYRNGKLDMNNDIDRYFKEFVENGGMTGYTQMKGRLEYEEEIHKTLAEGFKEMSRSKAGKAGTMALDALAKSFNGYFELVEKANEAVENHTRFAAYCASRMERRTIARAISDAKESSVNFNRAGAGWGTHSMNIADSSKLWRANRDIAATSATVLRHFMWFFNPAVQGMTKNFKLAFGGDAKQAARYIATFIAAPASLSILSQVLCAQAAQAFDNDDDKKKYGDNPYDQLPDYVRRQNFCLYLGHGRWMYIPLAIETRAAYGIADVFGRMSRGVKGEKGVPSELFEQFTQLTPMDLGGGGKVAWNNGWGSAVGTFTPSNIQPVLACIFNVKWTGSPVHSRRNYNSSDPEYQRALSTTNDTYVNLSKWLSNHTGGDEVVPGMIDINPGIAQYLVESYLGGVGKDAIEISSYLTNKAYDVYDYGAGSIFNGEGEADFTKLPILKAFGGKPDPKRSMSVDKTRWYAVRDNYMNYTKKYLDKYDKLGMEVKYQELANSKKGRIGEVIDYYDGEIKDWQEEKNSATNPVDIKHAQWQINELIRDAMREIDKIDKQAE